MRVQPNQNAGSATRHACIPTSVAADRAWGGKGRFGRVDANCVIKENTRVEASGAGPTGVDPDRSTQFIQSYVPEHAQAAWLLSALTSYGQHARMTQSKEKGSPSYRRLCSATRCWWLENEPSLHRLLAVGAAKARQP